MILQILLEEKYLKPSEALVIDLSKLEGDILVLGAGGEIRPSIAKLTNLAITKAGLDKRVIGVLPAFIDNK